MSQVTGYPCIGREGSNFLFPSRSVFGKLEEMQENDTRESTFCSSNCSASLKIPTPPAWGRPFPSPASLLCRFWTSVPSSHSRHLLWLDFPLHPPLIIYTRRTISFELVLLHTHKNMCMSSLCLISLKTRAKVSRVVYNLFTLRKFMDGYRLHNMSKKGEIFLHCRLDATSKWTTEAPAN